MRPTVPRIKSRRSSLQGRPCMNSSLAFSEDAFKKFPAMATLCKFIPSTSRGCNELTALATAVFRCEERITRSSGYVGPEVS